MIPRLVLLVEGADDEHVVKALCGRHALPKLDIKDCKGKSALLDAFPVWLLESDIAVLGAVIDADEDLTGSWISLRDRLAKAGYKNLPSSPDPAGTLVDPPPRTLLPRVGLWLMPNNQEHGILEDFLRFLVPTSASALLAHADSAIDGIPDSSRFFSPSQRPKALMHTWLAWQEEPGRPLGQSITKGVLDPEAEQAGVFVSWLRRLLETSKS